MNIVEDERTSQPELRRVLSTLSVLRATLLEFNPFVPLEDTGIRQTEGTGARIRASGRQNSCALAIAALAFESSWSDSARIWRLTATSSGVRTGRASVTRVHARSSRGKRPDAAASSRRALPVSPESDRTCFCLSSARSTDTVFRLAPISSAAFPT